MRRVVVTGLGTINPLGLDVETSFSRMLRGENSVAPITRFDTSEQAVKFAACVDWDPLKYFPAPDLRKLDPFTMWALIATDEALKDAGIDASKEDEPVRERYGCILGTGIGGITGIEEQHQAMLEKGPRRVSPHFVPRIMANAVSGQVAIRNGLLGTCFTTSSACASAGHAIGMAWRAIQLGDADLVITGGSESATTPLSLAGFASAKALSTRNDDPAAASRPFDKDRDGFVMSEGAGALILESPEHAERRGADAIAAVSGYGRTTDAYHVTAPDEEGRGVERAMRLALEDSGLTAEDVGHVNAHATATPTGDGPETKAISRVMPHALVSGTKSMTGHSFGAVGATEGIMCALAIKNEVVPPTINLENLAEDCEQLNYVGGESREAPNLKAAISNSMGFGGHNVVVAFSKV
jgi:3-oxoacyl-[acyl-carrier-protein] synthase II